jgi:hypothetical protein
VGASRCRRGKRGAQVKRLGSLCLAAQSPGLHTGVQELDSRYRLFIAVCGEHSL